MITRVLDLFFEKFLYKIRVYIRDINQQTLRINLPTVLQQQFQKSRYNHQKKILKFAAQSPCR